jgi:hypothetical protein
MAELWVDLRREGLFESVESLGDSAEARDVSIRVGATFLVADDGEAFAESGGELG